MANVHGIPATSTISPHSPARESHIHQKKNINLFTPHTAFTSLINLTLPLPLLSRLQSQTNVSRVRIRAFLLRRLVRMAREGRWELEETLEGGRSQVNQHAAGAFLRSRRGDAISQNQRDTCRKFLLERWQENCIDDRQVSSPTSDSPHPSPPTLRPSAPPYHNLTLSTSDYNTLQSLTHLDRHRLFKLVASIKDPPGVMTQEKRATLRDWIKTHQEYATLPTSGKWLGALCNQLDLSRRQVRYTLWYLRHQKRTRERGISVHNRQLVRDFLNQYGYDDILENHLGHLEKATNLSSIQLKSLMRRLTHEESALLTRQHVARVASIVEQHLCPSTGDPLSVPEKEIHQLAGDMQMSLDRVRQMIFREQQRRRRGEITQNTKEAIFSWFEAHFGDGESFRRDGSPGRSPTREQVQHLSRTFHLSPTQIRSLFRQFIDPPQSMTPQKKEIVRQWVEKHQRRPQSTQESSDLKTHAGLSSAQLSLLLTRFLDPRCELNPEKRAIISNWMRERHFEQPTTSEVREFQPKVGVAVRQIREEIAKIQRNRKAVGACGG
eukprot:CAMPEP_0117452752 /NCGR_PEP_ID=MMETSP0759-20121206/9804_1 /TAXON_ID=63605 /ORGANISM="Percolomonas cosmopolitus, Strain WS" /LENGTH=550 /DNA_ID=CAMNT_0005245631 /DNA_START=326 /DNA_END=1978 /DNA_ORIENTATION=-